MKKEILLYLMLLSLTLPAVAGDGDVKWKKDIINASRTGVTVPMADIPAALGTVRYRTYYAPNGRADQFLHRQSDDCRRGGFWKEG